MDITSTIKAIIILNLDGKRAIAKYYDETIDSKQFDKKIYAKTKNHKVKDEILIVDGLVVLHKCITDLHMYVVGGRSENPLILDRVLSCLVEVVTTLLSRNVEQQSMIENLDQVILTLDEICDGGLVLETDPELVLARVCIQDGTSEQSMASVFQSATEHVRLHWLKS